MTFEPAVKKRDGDDTPIFDDAWKAVYQTPGPYAPQPTRPRRTKAQGRA